MKRKKSNFTAETCLAELDQMRVRFKTAFHGFRRQLYETMGQAQRMISRLRRNWNLRRDFVRAVKKRKKETAGRKSARGQKFNLATEVLAVATGARSRSARKVAWKRGRVLNYLRETGVTAAKTATAIKSQGGIEKIFRTAVRTEKGTAGDIANNACPSTSPSVRRQEPSFPPPNRSNNQEVIVKVWMRLSDRDEMGDLPVGSRVLMSAIRVGQKDADFKISRIELPSKE
jgi:hypothetical protein